ncbi:MAG TPA: phage terminase large subunit [Blastocatellia bacterium]|nr:phage terminase large subunit [Blastocatellia bacterium]
MTLFYERGDEMLLSGPAGTGKSRACLEFLHLVASKYPAMRGLIVRKTRESLSESGLVTFEEKVLPALSTLRQGPSRRLRQLYAYPNGSQLVGGGMDRASRVMSTEFDLIYVQEATELSEDDWEMLTTRLRNGRVPYQQLIADCNPGPPTHWLKRRSDRGLVRLIESRHEDNPELWDHQRGAWTERGAAYIAKLDRLTGARRLRLRHGLWAMAEGMVYGDVWDPAVHLIDRFPIPADWPRYWVVDFGFTNPFVFQAWAEDHDGRLYRYREIYYTRRLVEDLARAILAAERDEARPVAIICDHDAEDRATLERHLGLGTTPARKSVSDGIQAVAARLRKAGDGKPRLFFLRDSLVGRDPQLAEDKRPTCTEEEFEGYVWQEAGAKEMPVKQDDHGLDCVRYLVAYKDLGASGGVFL